MGDSGGKVWRIDIAGAISNWKVSLLATLGSDSDRSADRRFFHAPDVVQSKDGPGDAGKFDAVILGSGDRANPLDRPIGSVRPDNYLFVLKDRNTQANSDTFTVPDTNYQFGDLLGNDFEITVTDPTRRESADVITDELRAFGDGTVSVPNFFGQQRFGSTRPVTHEVGLDVVRGNWEDAVLTYVGNPHEDERQGTREARTTVEESRDWAAALDEFPRRLRFERSMLHVLVENGGEEPADFREALEVLPDNLQSLFVHAAQSYAFNRMLSERLDRGLPFTRPVAGDVVCFADADTPSDLPLPDVDRKQRVTERRVDTVTRHCERGRAFVTAPLVGVETELADGDQGDIERAVLSELDLEPGDFDLPGEFYSEGTRRAVFVRTNLTVEHDPLTFSFSLPKGSYATVVLREYLKSDPLLMG